MIRKVCWVKRLMVVHFSKMLRNRFLPVGWVGVLLGDTVLP